MSMRPMTTPEKPLKTVGGAEWSHKYLTSQSMPKAGPLEWWYRLTAPPTPAASASFAQRELARRGRLASTIALFLLLVLSCVIWIGVFGPNHVIVPAIGVMLALVLVALIFNRRGRSNITGLILSLGIFSAIATVIRMSPGGLPASALGLFDLLVFTEVFVASLLPVNWVFVAAGGSVAFIIFDLLTQPRTASFAALMLTDTYPVLIRPVMLHLIVTLVLWLWVRSATQAIARADRAEVIAQLEHTLAEQEHKVAQEKRQLDASIQQIVETHMRVANGDFNARVPLTSDNALWPIAGALNNLLSRVQRLRLFEQEMQHLLPQLHRLRQESHELQQIRETLPLVITTMRKARIGRYPVQLIRNGTALDPLIGEITLLSQPSSSARKSLFSASTRELNHQDRS